MVILREEFILRSTNKQKNINMECKGCDWSGKHINMHTKNYLQQIRFPHLPRLRHLEQTLERLLHVGGPVLISLQRADNLRLKRSA